MKEIAAVVMFAFLGIAGVCSLTVYAIAAVAIELEERRHRQMECAVQCVSLGAKSAQPVHYNKQTYCACVKNDVLITEKWKDTGRR